MTSWRAALIRPTGRLVDADDISRGVAVMDEEPPLPRYKKKSLPVDDIFKFIYYFCLPPL